MKLESTEEFKKLKDYLCGVEITGDFISGIPHILENEENLGKLSRSIEEKKRKVDYEILMETLRIMHLD